MGIVMVVAAAASVWAIFHFVVTDAQLLLEYLRVLIWPTLVLVVLSFFRVPVEEKVRQLLRLDAFGASAEFSAEDQGRRLQRDLQGDLANLLEPLESPDRGEDVRSEDAEPGDDSDSAGPTHPSVQSPHSVADGPADKSDVATESQRTPAIEAEQVDSDGVGSSSDAWLEVAQALGMANGLLAAYERRMAVEPKVAQESLRKEVLAEASRARSVRNQVAHRQQDTRESLEAVIRKSAAWGYDMGQAGAPEAVPDVEWNSDGSWQIVTEVPKSKAKSAPRTTSSSGAESMRYLRQVKALEDEIKETERKRHSRFGALGTLSTLAGGLEDDGWLRELKKRLAMVDPGNPWTL